jgi:hypothetical protein
VGRWAGGKIFNALAINGLLAAVWFTKEAQVYIGKNVLLFIIVSV